MKKLVFAVVGVLVLVLLVVGGCAKKEPAAITPEEGKAVVSSCVSCHSDEDRLEEVATPEEKAESEETTGEG